MQKNNRLENYKVRLTKEELALFKEKAKHYGSVSAMIRKAVEVLDDRERKSRFELLEEFGEKLHQSDVQLSHVAGNLNQVVKRANQLAIGGILHTSFFENVLYPQIVIINKHILEIKKMQKSIFKQLISMK